MLTPLPMKTVYDLSASQKRWTWREIAQVDSAKPRPPYTGPKYRVGRALAPAPAFSRSRGEGACFALEPIRHPHSEPPEMGLARGSGARAGPFSVSCS